MDEQFREGFNMAANIVGRSEAIDVMLEAMGKPTQRQQPQGGAAPSPIPSGLAGAEDLRPTRVYPPIGEVANGDLTKQDMLSFVTATVSHHGLVGHNIDGYNEFIETGIGRIMTELFNIDRTLRNERTQSEEDRACESFKVHVSFNNVKVDKPVCPTFMTGQFTDLHPSRSRLTGIPYSGAVTLGSTATVQAHFKDGHVEEKTAEIPPFMIGKFPIMVRSARCHTHFATRENLKRIGEDPEDPGGYFIAKRGEWVVELLENIIYNEGLFHVKVKANELVRAEFLSQPGGAFENSSQIIVRYMANEQITIEIRSTKFDGVRLPFFLLYRLFGMTSDREIAATAVFDVEDTSPITARMLDIFERAFQLADPAFAFAVGELNREKLIQSTAERVAKFLTNPAAYASNENAVQYLNEDLLGNAARPGGLDRVILPHMGQTSESRIRKLRFIGLLIHKMLLVHLGILPPTDRDSYRNKRVHGSGVSLAKAFKTQVNNSVIVPMFRAFRRELKNNPWKSISEKTLADTFRNSLATSDLNRAMEQSITSGNKTIVVRRRAATNRVSSDALERKNALNTFSALRTIVTQNAGNAAKATERADKMRRVHPDYTGFICVSQSADTGENVGMRKQLAITASVCSAGDAITLKMRLRDDPALVALDAVTSDEMLRRGLARVFVNGEWVGCCASAAELAARYRALRRERRGVDPYTTICWDPVTDEVKFWLDVGRLRRPLLIVDNNVDEYDAAVRARRRGGGVAPESFRGVVVDGDDGLPRGLYSAAAEEYVELGPEWHRDVAAAAATSRGEYARGRLALYMTADGTTRLAANGLAARREPPPGVLDLAAAARAVDGGAATTTATREIEFVQNIRFTREHARGILEGRLTLGDLVAEGIAEYVTPEEQENCLVAMSIAELRERRHDFTRQYSHCDVEQAILGLAAHVSPYGNHTQPARITYETNQGRQTGGWYVGNFPYRTDKNRFFQFYNEVPLVRTFAHKLIPSNGSNTIIAYASYGGDNQEDSTIVDQASADFGLFAGAFFRFELAELEKGEMFCNPDALTTKNLKPNASYEKLVDGFVRVGSTVRYGDVLVGRVAKLSRGRDGGGALGPNGQAYQFTDRSVVYKFREPAVVEAVYRPRGANDELFGVVKLRYERPERIGDKMSSREGNKSIIAKMLPRSDMPFTESGMTPDMIINTHCIAGETPITTYYGTSRRMDSLPEDGGEVLWGWDSEKCGFTESHQLKRMTRGEDDVVRVMLQDGRTLRCTANHKVLTAAADGTFIGVEAGLLTREMRVVAGPWAVLDEPAPDEENWSFVTSEAYEFHMRDTIARERSLAFARILGLLSSDGTVVENPKSRGHIAQVYLGHPLDIDVFLRDVRIITGKTPVATRGEGIWCIRLPNELSRMAAVPGMAIGKKVHAEPDWPHFLLEPSCPVAVVREFLAGLFGGDGHAPCLIRQGAANRKATSGEDRYSLHGVALDLTIIDDHKAAMRVKMTKLSEMLDRVGVPGALVIGPIRRESSQHSIDEHPRSQFGVRLPPSTAFAERVGFRYCIQKAARLDAASAYWRTLENVRRQHNYVFEQVCHRHTEGYPLSEALDIAREDLFETEPALNEYYSLLTMNIVNNRRRSRGRQTTLDRLDYTQISDAETFFREAGCLEWFMQRDVDGNRVKTDYITKTDEMHIAPYTLRVMDVRKDGRAVTYDISVPIAKTFVAGGFTVFNSFPSRMTIGQLIETTMSKICARKGVIADGTAFLPVDHVAMADELVRLGFRFNGRERMYNGMTGEYFDAAIFIGPTFEQRLQKFVLDDEQAVGGSGPTDATTGQPLGGKQVEGGLRLGEMEAWCLESHGSMMNLYEKRSTDSDGRTLYVCRGCSAYAVYNEYQGIYQCRTCGEMADISAVDGTKTATLFHEELAASGVRMRLGLRPRAFEAGAGAAAAAAATPPPDDTA